MSLRAWKNRFLANPWIYDTFRPLVVGGIDHRLLAEFCATGPKDRVFDLGCGTGQIVRYLGFERYLGVDVDARALKRASIYSSASVRFVQGNDWDALLHELQATVILMIGVTHHVSDDVFTSIIRRIRQASDCRQRIVTIEPSYFPGQHLNNLLSRLDRGGYVRAPAEYEVLFKKGGLRILRNKILSNRLRYVRYAGYHLALE